MNELKDLPIFFKVHTGSKYRSGIFSNRFHAKKDKAFLLRIIEFGAFILQIGQEKVK